MVTIFVLKEKVNVCMVKNYSIISLYSKRIGCMTSNRLYPFSGNVLSWGNAGGGGDFNVQGRTLVTIPTESGVSPQLDFVYSKDRITAGFRIKADIPVNFLGGNQIIEPAAGIRFKWVWPRAFQNGWPGIFGPVRK